MTITTRGSGDGNPSAERRDSDWSGERGCGVPYKEVPQKMAHTLVVMIGFIAHNGLINGDVA